MTDTSNYIHKEASKLFDKNSSSFNEKEFYSIIYENEPFKTAFNTLFFAFYIY